MSKKKKYFPNNVRMLRAAPAEMFPSCTYEEFMEWKIAGWDLPDGIECIIRTMDTKTYKVKEYVYQRPEYARRKVAKLMDEGGVDITVCTHEAIHHVFEEPIDDEDDE